MGKVLDISYVGKGEMKLFKPNDCISLNGFFSRSIMFFCLSTRWCTGFALRRPQ